MKDAVVYWTFWILFTLANAVDSATLHAGIHPNLSCFDCSESFKLMWTPNTPCQNNLSEVPLRSCHSEDRYCRVDRTTVKGTVVSIRRSCTQKCLYGCRAYGYAITQWRCTSCCQGYACNTDNAGTTFKADLFFTLQTSIVLFHLSKQ